MWAPSWSWILAANVLLGVSQGLTWSATVIMNIDLAGPKNRGLAMGLANLVAALRVAARGDLPGPVITVTCDSWDRYRAKSWMQNWEEA